VAAHLTEFFDILDDAPSIVIFDLGEGERLSATSLVEQQDVVQFGIPLAAMGWRHSAARTAVKKYRGLRPGPPHALVVERMSFADVEHVGLVRFDFRV
jgi:hypothetical protein